MWPWPTSSVNGITATVSGGSLVGPTDAHAGESITIAGHSPSMLAGNASIDTDFVIAEPNHGSDAEPQPNDQHDGRC
jgi:hypothetical protein